MTTRFFWVPDFVHAPGLHCAQAVRLLRRKDMQDEAVRAETVLVPADGIHARQARRRRGLCQDAALADSDELRVAERSPLGVE